MRKPLHAQCDLKKHDFYKGSTPSDWDRAQPTRAEIQVCVSTKLSSWPMGCAICDFWPFLLLPHLSSEMPMFIDTARRREREREREREGTKKKKTESSVREWQLHSLADTSGIAWDWHPGFGQTGPCLHLLHQGQEPSLPKHIILDSFRSLFGIPKGIWGIFSKAWVIPGSGDLEDLSHCHPESQPLIKPCPVSELR